MFTYFLVGEDTNERLRRISSSRAVETESIHQQSPTTFARHSSHGDDDDSGNRSRDNELSIEDATGTSNNNECTIEVAPVTAMGGLFEQTGSDEGRGSGSEERSGRSRQRANSDAGSITSGASSTMSLVTWRDDVMSNKAVAVDMGCDDDDEDNYDDGGAIERRKRYNRHCRTGSVGMRDHERPFMRTKRDENDVVMCTSAMIPLLDWNKTHDATLAV